MSLSIASREYWAILPLSIWESWDSLTRWVFWRFESQCNRSVAEGVKETMAWVDWWTVFLVLASMRFLFWDRFTIWVKPNLSCSLIASWILRRSVDGKKGIIPSCKFLILVRWLSLEWILCCVSKWLSLLLFCSPLLNLFTPNIPWVLRFLSSSISCWYDV